MSRTLPAPTPANRTLLQSFEWHSSPYISQPNGLNVSTSHYVRLTQLIPTFAALGLSDVWLPPGCKANSPHGNGFDCYDLWDLGEFDQKGTVSTKWGSRQELQDLIRCAHEHGLKIIWDAVLNHKTAGDATEECWAVEVDPHDRRVEICSPKKIEAWLKFDFPGRGRRYSQLQWRAEHFNGTDWDQKAERLAIYKLIDDPTHARIKRQEPAATGLRRLRLAMGFGRGLKKIRLNQRLGKGWAQDVDDLHGNYDYLMFSNIDYTHPAVRQDVLDWGRWMVQEVGVDGFRLDAAQHFSSAFTKTFIETANAASTQGCLMVGELWTGDARKVIKWLDVVGNSAYAFDVPLLMNFARLSQALDSHGDPQDLRTLKQGSLLMSRPRSSVTFIANHDTQSGQASYTPINGQLKIIFYAYILLREEGLPCVFWGDLFGARGPTPEPPACVQYGKSRSLLPDLIAIRALFAYGKQKDHVKESRCVAWSRAGTHDRPGCIVIISIEAQTVVTRKKIATGQAGQTWINLLTDEPQYSAVTSDARGVGLFPCNGRCAAVYVSKDEVLARGFPVQFDLSMGH